MKKRNIINIAGSLLLLIAGCAMIHSCARMQAPDGGWYDETPPYVVSASPEDRGTNVRSNKVQILFNEFIKLESAAEKVVVSPPQIEMPDIKAQGKRIVVELKDTLKDNITYTIDFSDAISDNNEGNPMGNYTYSFSTGDEIDTLEVSGQVLNASDLEPVKGILVGLVTPDSVGGTMMRVSRTDSRGFFVIRGIAPGEYCCYALEDQDGNYRFSQKSETLGFNHETFSPYCRPDKRQDTIWVDELHIKDIELVPYTHFFPDNITLFAFQHENQERFFLKTERKDPDNFTVFFSGPGTVMPEMRLMDMPEMENPFVVEASQKLDTITYWLRDTALVNRDTLRIEMKYETTDTLGAMVMATDTLEVLSKTPYAKRLKALKEELEKWDKALEKKRKNGEEITDSIMPPEEFKMKYDIANSLSPDGSIFIHAPAPLARIDSAAIHLYVQQDSLWFRAPFKMQRPQSPYATDRDIEVIAEWIPEAEYSFEVDTLAFESIYGLTSKPFKAGLKVGSLTSYATLFVNVSGAPCDSMVVELIDSSDKVLKRSLAVDGTAEFYYVNPGNYYMRAFADRNGNGKWDTGDFELDQQPEQVYYYYEKIECKAKWDVTKNWNVSSRPFTRQKPGEITKQKGEKQKTIKKRNKQRAEEKGIELPDELR